MNTSMKWGRKMRHGAVVAAVVMLSACGGGGGNDPAPPPGGSVSGSTATLTGVASKGLLKNAVVRAFAVLPDGGLGAQIGASVRTDGNGRYRLIDLPAGTLVYVEVVADAQTLMADEATGVDIRPPVGFKLRAARVLGQGEETLQVTPFSDMAVALMLAQGGLKADVVNAANQKIVAYVGEQVLTTAPTFNAGNPTNSAALTLAAVSRMARTGVFPRCAVSGALQADKVACVVEEMAGRGPQDALLASELETARRALASSYTGPAVAPITAQSPFLLTQAAVSGIAEAKTLFNNLRSNLASDVTETVASRARTVANELQNSVSPLGGDIGALLAGVVQASTVLQDPEGELGAFQSPQFGTELSDGRGAACTLFSDVAGTVPAISHATVNAVRCAVEVGGEGFESASVSGSSSGGSGEYARSSTKIFDMVDIKVSKSSAQGVLSVETASYSQSLTESWAANGAYSRDLSGKQWSGAPYGAEAIWNLTQSEAEDGAFALRGALVPAVGMGSSAADRRMVDLLITSSTPGEGLTRLSLQGSIQAMASGKPGLMVAVAKGSFIDASGVDEEDTQIKQVALLVDIVMPSGAVVAGRLDATDFMDNSISDNNPRLVVFQGAVMQQGGQLLFRGEVTLDAPFDPVVNAEESAERYAGGQLTLKGQLNMANRPDMLVNLGVILGGSEAHSFKGSYVQGTTTVLLEGDYAEGSGSAGQFKLSTPSGVTVQGLSSDRAFLITKGSAVLGEFTRDDGRILYADGSYEQF